MTAKTRLLAYIYIVMCGGCIAAGIALCTWIILSGGPGRGATLEFIGSAFVALSVVYFIPGLLGGFGLLRGEPWARTVLIVLSALVIFVFPIGTALAGFGLWVLLGPDSKRLAPPVTKPPRAPLFRRPSFSVADRKRHFDAFVIAAGIAAGFVCMIGTGYRATGTSGSPIGDVLYVASIAVLVLVIGFAVRRLWRQFAGGLSWREWAADRAHWNRLSKEHRRSQEARRRWLAALAADPVRRTYFERIQRGEPWSEEQIEYHLNADRLATCAHLQPVESEMRATGIEVRLERTAEIRAGCRVDMKSLRARFSLPAYVEHTEPPPQMLDFASPLPSLLACSECQSSIDVVHRLDATSKTPVFPSTARPRPADTSLPVDLHSARFIELRSRILRFARLIDAPAETIPTHGHSVGTGLRHIEIDGETYHYVCAERGEEFERFSTTSRDELLYRVFRDITFSTAATLAHPDRPPDEDYRRKTFPLQLALLERLNPEWVARCAAEHEETLARHPFVDKR